MTVLSKLSLASAYFRSETFEVWDATAEDFVTAPEITGRLYPVDRFKSIYHRPVMRETLSLAETVDVPASLVVRHKATQRIFMLSAVRRRDVDADVSYDSLISAHAVEPGSGGYATVRRYATVGAGDDLGVLVGSDALSTYYSIELRTQSADPDTHDEFVGHYFMTVPEASSVVEGDYILSGADSFRVDALYDDAGFKMLRVAKEDYDKETMTYYLPTGAGGSYTPSTGVAVPTTTVERLFSGAIVEDYMEDLESTLVISGMATIAVGLDDIGFTPQVGDEVLAQGERRTIQSKKIASDRKQWMLRTRLTTV